MLLQKYHLLLSLLLLISDAVASDEVTLKTGAWLHSVHRTFAEMAVDSRGASHVTTKQRCAYTTSVDIRRDAF